MQERTHGRAKAGKNGDYVISCKIMPKLTKHK